MILKLLENRIKDCSWIVNQQENSLIVLTLMIWYIWQAQKKEEASKTLVIKNKGCQ